MCWCWGSTFSQNHRWYGVSSSPSFWYNIWNNDCYHNHRRNFWRYMFLLRKTKSHTLTKFIKKSFGLFTGHVNPAVSIALAVTGDLSWYSVPGYVISQFFGAMIGALLGWALLYRTQKHKI